MNIETVMNSKNTATGRAFFDHLKARKRRHSDINIKLIARRINRPLDELVEVLKTLESEKIGSVENYRNKPSRFHFNISMPDVVALSEGQLIPKIQEVKPKVRRFPVLTRPMGAYGGTILKVTGNHLSITKGGLHIEADMPKSSAEANGLALLLKAV